MTVREEPLKDTHEPVIPTSKQTGGEVTPDIKPVEIAIAPELHEKNRADYEDREQRENEERIAMVMEYIHFIMPRIANKGDREPHLWRGQQLDAASQLQDSSQ